MQISEPLIQRVLAVVDAGLTAGLGQPKPGEMCVEAALCYALGEPHSDKPSCVGVAVREFKIRLNDSSNWSSAAARAKGMRRLAIAQIGSNTIDQVAFARHIVLAVTRQILPQVLRAVAHLIPEHKDRLEEAAVGCVLAKDLKAASAAAGAAGDAAWAAGTAAGAAARAAGEAAGDAIIGKAADMAVEALCACNSPGCQWLDVVDKIASIKA